MDAQEHDREAPIAKRIFASEAEENEYRADATPQERLTEMLRLTREKWGDACDKPMEKVVFIRRLGWED